MNKVKIYAQEIVDGIAEVIASNNSIAYASIAKESTIEHEKTPLQVSVASANPNQLDLFYLESILASTGWNENHDIFLPDEMWAAKATPEDKQFNYMHDEKDIIGHITGNYVTDYTGNLILPDSEQTPKEFNIVTSAVIYTSWTDPELSARMNKIIAEIKEGKWFVSMECLFPNFDYELKSESGERKLITRSEATSYLSKYLRAYGGDGVYQGYTIGRVLRNYTFSGKGLVNRPANKKSLITKIVTDEKNNKEEKSLSGEINMSVDLTKELDDVKSQLAQALETINTLNGFKGKAETLEGSVADLQNQIKTLAEELTSAKSELAEAVKQKDQYMNEMDKMKKDQKMSKRKASLADAGLEDAEVEETLASTESLEDEAFDKIVAMMKKKAAKMPKEKTEASKETETITVVVEPEKTSASTVNDLAEKPKTINLREEMGKWIGANCLKTLK